MSVRIYPSQQQTNTTAVGSLIIVCNNFSNIRNRFFVTLRPSGDYIYQAQRSVNGINVYKILNNGVTFRINFVTLSGTAQNKRITIYRRIYTSDDINGNFGITTDLIQTTTSTSFQVVSDNIPSVPVGTYNFEYIAVLDVL